jgi:hypothetical protein
MAERWVGLERPLFKGKLIDYDGCKCAQGDVLFCAGYSDEELRSMSQNNADAETARLLGISRTHAVLLRNVNDRVGGAPQLVLTNPEQIIGDKAETLLAFWFFLDRMGSAARSAAWSAAESAARSAAESAAWRAAWSAARSAAGSAAQSAAWSAAGSAAQSAARSAAESAAESAAYASSEIQGMDVLESKGRQPYFLAFFGFKTWDSVRALVGGI